MCGRVAGVGVAGWAPTSWESAGCLQGSQGAVHGDDRDGERRVSVLTTSWLIIEVMDWSLTL